MEWLTFFIGWIIGIITVCFFISKDPNLPDKVRAEYSAWKLKRTLKKTSQDFKNKGIEIIDVEEEKK